MLISGGKTVNEKNKLIGTSDIICIKNMKEAVEEDKVQGFFREALVNQRSVRLVIDKVNGGIRTTFDPQRCILKLDWQNATTKETIEIPLKDVVPKTNLQLLVNHHDTQFIKSRTLSPVISKETMAEQFESGIPAISIEVFRQNNGEFSARLLANLKLLGVEENWETGFDGRTLCGVVVWQNKMVLRAVKNLLSKGFSLRNRVDTIYEKKGRG